ncbi:hypothetical protein BP5796_02627 [Coleophoma crateriformis]|uniref:Uncharacterized protein n=1 Tax=Coleophoma crateriformis TaxID=565419 RepID=A0A3D8SYS9_9HELO|nr:hypothetical protein BP5796_02627 [Coleophoma crateriformis]
MKRTGPEKRGSDPRAKSHPPSFEHDEDGFELQSLSPGPQPQPQYHPSNPFAILSSFPRNIVSSPSGILVASASRSAKKTLSPTVRAHVVPPTSRYTTTSPSSYAPLPPSNPFASSIQGQAPISPSYKQFHPSNPFAALVKAEASFPTAGTIDSNQVSLEAPFDHHRPADRHRPVDQVRPFDDYRQADHLRPIDPHQAMGNNGRVDYNNLFESQNYHAISKPPITPDSSQAQASTPRPPTPFEKEGSSSKSYHTPSRREQFRERYNVEGFHLPLSPPAPAHLRGATPTTMGGDSLYELNEFNPSNENLAQDTMSTPIIPPEGTNQPKKPKKAKKVKKKKKKKKKKKLTKEDMATFGKMTSGLNLEETNFAGQKLSTLEHDDLARLLLSKAIAVKTETTVTYEDAPDAGQERNAELGVVPNEWDLPTVSQNFGSTTTVEVGGRTFTIDSGSALVDMLPLPGDGPLDKGKKEVEGIQASLRAYIEAEASKHQIPDSDGVARIKEDLAGAHLPMVAFESEPTKFWKLRRKRNNVKKKRGGKKKKLGAASTEPGVHSSALEPSRAARELVLEGEGEGEEEDGEGTLVGEEPPEDAETEEMAGRLSGITI